MEAAVSVQNLVKRYGKVTAVAGIDLEVRAGSIFGLVGPNGAGKTTVIRVLAGAIPPDEGSVRVLGMDPQRERGRLRMHLGYMPQSSVLYDDLTPAENVAFFARGQVPEDLDRRVHDSLQFVDLLDRADDTVRTLSGGMRQRVSLAAALVHSPPLLMLDEPTAGVDPELRHEFWTRFRRLADEGTTILISTHQMDEVIHCDRVAILRGGVLLSDSTPQELISSGRATVRIDHGGVPREYALADYPTELPALLRAEGLDPQTTRIEVSPASLEDVILGLIRPVGEG